MSDAFNQLPWRPWALNDLARKAPPLALPSLAGETEDRIMVRQAALEEAHNKALQEAKRNGFAEGHTQGQQEGYQAGLLLGQEEGRRQIQLEQQPVVAQLQMLVSEFQHSLDALDSVVTERLAQLALSAAKLVLGQTSDEGNNAMLQQIQQFLQQEPTFTGKPQLRVHPSLLPLVEQHLGATLSLQGWRLIADADLHPGGCKVSAPEGSLDASLATRWHELCRLAAPGEL
ncbi:flagellar assembly protein FliH [Acerihabitans sp. TG2]|uniref:flagellar assembly protein FliH n=1 Tax=Acerihabitans sp. TG2 TaxID=3096008 RepID=UPI002B222BE4|nr:flagellar assembly protein FliH [Acerihabitans sp. TG2]MEA9392586.1 flagellar assembly protein FliH [Acerihabitans sp. TG2]